MYQYQILFSSRSLNTSDREESSHMTTSSALPPVRRGTIRHQVVRSLLSAIVAGRFSAGHRMVVQSLAAELGVSATPIREALVELAGIGVVDILPNRSAVCRRFDRAEVRGIYQIRRVLEVEATHEACGKIAPVELARMHQVFTQLMDSRLGTSDWSHRAVVADIELHRLILTHVASGRLMDEINRYNQLVQVVREVVDNDLRAQEIAVSEHLEIVRALQNNQPADAALAMDRHIRSTAAVVEASMFSHRSMPSSEVPTEAPQFN